MSFQPRFAPGASGPRARALALLILAIAAAPAAAMGRREDPLIKAQKLIDDQNYNEAKLYLARFMRDNPERFDEALRKIREIERLQNDYTRTSNELLATMQQEPGNDDKILAQIARLESIQRNPNATDKATIVKLKETRLALKNQDLMRRIMTAGRGLVDQGRFTEAARTYEQGFVLFEPEFLNAGYDELTVKAVTGLVARSKELIPAYEGLQDRVRQAAGGLAQAFRSGEPAAIEAALPAAEAALTELARRRLEEHQAGQGLAAWTAAIPTEGKSIIEYSYMTYANLFIRGRPESLRPIEGEKGKPEGIAGAMLAQWSSLLEELQAAAEPAVEGAYRAAEAAYDAGEREEARRGFLLAARLAAPALRTLSLWSLLAPTDIDPELSDWGRKAVVAKAADYERLRHLGRIAAAQARLSELALGAEALRAEAEAYIAALPPAPELGPALAFLDGKRSSLKSGQARIEAERSASAALAEELGRWTVAGLGSEDATRAQGAYDGRIASTIEEARAFEVGLVASAGGLEYAELERDYEARAAAGEEAARLLAGSSSEDPALAGILLRYPSQSIRILLAEESALRSLRQAAAGYAGRLERELPFVASAPSVRIWSEKARLLDQRAAELQASRTALLAKAQDQKRQADANRLRAEELLEGAKAALRREDFDAARKSLDDSGKRYLASLSYEEDQALRQGSSRELGRLGEEIVKAENDKVVRDTRALINQGKEAYFAGAFDRAESALLRGRERWKTTHNDDLKTPDQDEGRNPEVEYWLALVQTAISVKTGRDIPATAPLYPEMSQTLSLAKKFYEEGARLLARKDKSGALLAFSQAKAKINEVRLVYPLNQDAGILALRIDQLTDPDSFRQAFSTRLASARTRVRAARENPRGAQEAYAELQNLAAIDAKYPGLQALVLEAEYALGMRLPPPDPAKVKLARDLVAAARRIYDSGDTGRFSFAVEQLNRALENDPNNQGAADLKDRIQTFQGGSAQLVLSASAESQYQQAIALFQSGNYLGASAIVDRLLLDPKNKRVQKLLDLYNQIRSRI
ncbi:MAG TPA: hypothetical protein P5133_08870 [Spirochaetia bacterium]|nr:hypothetical protein [Spirochaetia bacterium]